jgi:regulator of sigma E protease
VLVADLLIFIVVIGGLIIGHELGHFLAARLSGIQVEEFGLGYPPRMLTLFTAAGTRFTLNWIPFGGFVRIAGEDDPTIPNGLASASKHARTAVLLAGPVANVLLAFFAFTAAFKFAAPNPNEVIFTSIAPGSPAQAAALQPGDKVLRVNQVEIDGFRSLQETVRDHLGQEIELTILREGSLVKTRLIPRPDPPEGQGPIGVTLGNPTMRVGWGEAVLTGLESTRLQFTEILRLPARLLRNEVEPEEARLTGLKGMYDMLSWASEIDRNAQRPFLTLNLVGVISAGLAIANLLPFPALDGGRLTFVFLETLLGRRIEPRLQALAHTIGFALLLAILVYVNFYDFINPIQLP